MVHTCMCVQSVALQYLTIPNNNTFLMEIKNLIKYCSLAFKSLCAVSRGGPW